MCARMHPTKTCPLQYVPTLSFDFLTPNHCNQLIYLSFYPLNFYPLGGRFSGRGGSGECIKTNVVENLEILALEFLPPVIAHSGIRRRRILL